ncbi:MAG: hypothetical protein JWN50_666 [Parcubacteria group bacterium]|nr:hypothetical protein [Parcubacteria group bacterium]
MKSKTTGKKLWFRAKLYGWGWYPISWEGWLITIIYVLGLVNFALQADGEHSGSDFLIHFALRFIPLTILFLIICYGKGERPRWRWGK